jgi:hypothetical protein
MQGIFSVSASRERNDSADSSGTSVHATWVCQTILTCSGTCTPKWRHVSNHVESLWGYK